MGLIGGIGESKTKTTVTSIDARQTVGAEGSGKAKAISPTITGRGRGTFKINDYEYNLDEGAISIGSGSLTINQSTDADLLGRLFDQQRDTVEQILESDSASSRAADQRLGTFLDQLGQLAENQQTGGESERDKTILWIILAVMAVFIFRRS